MKESIFKFLFGAALIIALVVAKLSNNVVTVSDELATIIPKALETVATTAETAAKDFDPGLAWEVADIIIDLHEKEIKINDISVFYEAHYRLVSQQMETLDLTTWCNVENASDGLWINYVRELEAHSFAEMERRQVPIPVDLIDRYKLGLPATWNITQSRCYEFEANKLLFSGEGRRNLMPLSVKFPRAEGMYARYLDFFKRRDAVITEHARRLAKTGSAHIVWDKTDAQKLREIELARLLSDDGSYYFLYLDEAKQQWIERFGASRN